MKLWTIRSASEIAIINTKEKLVTDSKLIEPEFIIAYDWIVSELSFSVKKPDYCDYPIWAWKCWDEERSCRPDLRVRWGCRHEELVLVTINIPDHLVLLSEFSLWHFVLNRWYLPKNEEDEVNFDNKLTEAGVGCSWPYPEPFHSLVVESWQRIFKWNQLDTNYHGTRNGASIQAVFWELKKEWIEDIKFFKSK